MEFFYVFMALMFFIAVVVDTLIIWWLIMKIGKWFDRH